MLKQTRAMCLALTNDAKSISWLVKILAREQVGVEVEAVPDTSILAECVVLGRVPGVIDAGCRTG